jgi:hypothetical protein
MRTDQEFARYASLSEFPGQSLLTRYQASADPGTGTAETVDRMRAATEKDAASPQVMRATGMALLFCCPDSEAGRVRAIHDWIASSIRFRQDDPVMSHMLGFDDELDLLIHPARLLTMQRPSGDCDDFTMLTCAMLLCAGIPCEIVTIKADPRDPSRFSHVYAQAVTNEGTIPVDASQSAQHGYPCGWEPEQGVTDRQTWGVMMPPQIGTGLHGYVGGLGQNADDFGGSDTTAADLAALQAGGGVTPGNCAGGDCVIGSTTSSSGSSSSSGVNWTQLGTALGADAARIAQLATLPAGYTLNAAGQPVIAGSAAITTGLNSLFANPIIWLLIGAAVLIPAMEGGKR